jgi:hypothetical protein
MPGCEGAVRRREARRHGIPENRGGEKAPSSRSISQFGGGITGRKFGDLGGQRAGLRGFFLFFSFEEEPAVGWKEN